MHLFLFCGLCCWHVCGSVVFKSVAFLCCVCCLCFCLLLCLLCFACVLALFCFALISLRVFLLVASCNSISSAARACCCGDCALFFQTTNVIELHQCHSKDCWKQIIAKVENQDFCIESGCNFWWAFFFICKQNLKICLELFS